jgi:hypothetical protein
MVWKRQSRKKMEGLHVGWKGVEETQRTVVLLDTERRWQ